MYLEKTSFVGNICEASVKRAVWMTALVRIFEFYGNRQGRWEKRGNRCKGKMHDTKTLMKGVVQLLP